MLPEGWISCWGSILFLGSAGVDRLQQACSCEPGQESWERSAKMGTSKTCISSLHQMYQMKYLSHCEWIREDGSAFISIIIKMCIYCLSPGQYSIPFWWIADRVQRCVKIHKQHLQQWRPGTPSVPHSPAKSAHVPSHLLRPPSLLPLPCIFLLLLNSRRPIIRLDCWLSTGWFGTVASLECNWAELTAVQKYNRQCIIDYVCDLTLMLRTTPLLLLVSCAHA